MVVLLGRGGGGVVGLGGGWKVRRGKACTLTRIELSSSRSYLLDFKYKISFKQRVLLRDGVWKPLAKMILSGFSGWTICERRIGVKIKPPFQVLSQGKRGEAAGRLTQD